MQLKLAKNKFVVVFWCKQKCLFPVLLNLSAAKAMPIWHFISPYLVPSLQYVLLLPSYLKQIKSSTQAKNAIANQIGTLRSLINEHVCLFFQEEILFYLLLYEAILQASSTKFCLLTGLLDLKKNYSLNVYSSQVVYQKPESR